MNDKKTKILFTHSKDYSLQCRWFTEIISVPGFPPAISFVELMFNNVCMVSSFYCWNWNEWNEWKDSYLAFWEVINITLVSKVLFFNGLLQLLNRSKGPTVWQFCFIPTRAEENIKYVLKEYTYQETKWNKLVHFTSKSLFFKSVSRLRTYLKAIFNKLKWHFFALNSLNNICIFCLFFFGFLFYVNTR